MITLCKASARQHDRRAKLEQWQTFQPGAGYGTLSLFEEARLAPGGVVSRGAHRETETLTYVREGSVSNEDSHGRTDVIRTGEFQRLTGGIGIRHRETNASLVNRVHMFQVALRSRMARQPGQDTKRFSAAQRRGRWCLVASSDGRAGSLLLQQDAAVFSAILQRGQHLVHELRDGRRAWLHVLTGAVVIGTLTLRTGDGVGVSGERSVSLTADAEGDSELLLVDVDRIDLTESTPSK